MGERGGRGRGDFKQVLASFFLVISNWTRIVLLGFSPFIFSFPYEVLPFAIDFRVRFAKEKLNTGCGMLSPCIPCVSVCVCASSRRFEPW